LREKSYSRFTDYLECLNDKEKPSARMQAIQEAEKADQQDIYLAANLDLLLGLDEADRAQSLVLANQQAVADIFYDSLLKLAKQFEAKQCWLAATVCYRALLLDILTQARYKAYAHAARYYKKLASLSAHIEHFVPLEDNTTFVQQLNEKHGRKSSFWQRVL
jgi:uncharacterized protein DUF6880